MTAGSPTGRRIALVVPYGEASESFFPDTLLSWLSARARRRGHTTKVFRVYYDGRDPARDAEIRARLIAALDGFAPTDVVLERIFDLDPLLEVRARHGARIVMVCRGDGFDPDPRLDGWIGRTPGLHRGRTRRTPTIADIVREYDAWLGDDTDESDALPVVELDLAHEVLAIDARPAITTPRLRTLFASVGCPYSGDPRKSAFYAGLPVLDQAGEDDGLSLLGCAFCPMGGDYQRAEEGALVAWVAAQAFAIREAVPETEGFVLSDQAPLSYLSRLIDATRSLAPVRWLVAMRADVLVRERTRVERTIEAARACGHTISLYLTGFESFSDRELERYVKGTTAAELVRAVDTMRGLAREHGASFRYGEDRGHSLILWSPWTSLDDLAASLEVMRANGLRELFWDLGRNRLRLTHEVPITLAAARDGALSAAWDDGDDGAARGKGYATERPWRFLDRETALAHRVATTLRDRLGRDTELAQLRAAVAFARGRGDLDAVACVAELHAGLDTLDRTLGRWLSGPRGASDPPRGTFVRAEVLDVGVRCSCGRPWCAERDAYVEPAWASARLDAMLASSPAAIVFAGGDALAHPEIVDLADRVRSKGAVLGIALPSRPSRAIVCDAISVDVACLEEVAGAGDATRAFVASRGRDEIAIEARVLVNEALLDADPSALLQAIRDELAPDVVRVVVPLDAIPLARLDRVCATVDGIARAAKDVDVALEASPLAAGPTWRARCVQRRSLKRPA